MNEMDELYPGYGLCKHKGYWTAEHISCINKPDLPHPPPHLPADKRNVSALKLSQRSRQTGRNPCRRIPQKQRAGYYRNQYRCSCGEIDIIAQENDYIVFTEVRTKTGNLFGTPEESISQIKKKHPIETAYTYLDEKINWNQTGGLTS